MREDNGHTLFCACTSIVAYPDQGILELVSYSPVNCMTLGEREGGEGEREGMVGGREIQ